ncbi:MAG: hypothetical protein LBS67_03005 [Clostridiales Family XIII bacterium]|jgi:hypothetical protein|nr:hypothetical protein [Clostridiales Family XIII bacterium]
MDFSPDTGKNRRNTGGISRIFAEVRRKIGGSDGGHELISVSLNELYKKIIAFIDEEDRRRAELFMSWEGWSRDDN